MAEDEIRKHGKAVYEALSSHGKSWQHKLKDILVEILIIVFAVSISIWFHNRSEEWKDGKQEKEFLIGLKSDLQADLKEMAGDTAVYHVILKCIAYFRRVGSGEQLNYDSLNRYSWIFFTNARKQTRNSRFEALKSSGKLDIIENKTLLTNIISLYQEINPNIVEGNKEFSNYIANNIGSFFERHAKLDSSNNIINWLELFRSSQLRMALLRGNAVQNILKAYEVGIQKCHEIINQIDSEIKD